MEAEVLQPGSYSPAEAVPLSDLFGDQGAYADPGKARSYNIPSTAPVPRPQKKRSLKSSKSPGTDTIARFVLFGMLPCAAFFMLLGSVGIFRNVVILSFLARDRVHRPPRVHSNEPAPSGLAITIWDAKQRAGGVFSVEYRVDNALSPTGNYFWVINGPAGNVEFPIPGTTWAKQRQQLSGRAPAAGGTELNGPLTCYIEEQVGSTRRRISNQVPVGQ